MEFEGRKNLKVFMELVALRSVICRGKKMQVSRISNSFSYDFRTVRAWMIESNNEMYEGQNQRGEIDFNCVKPHLHPELLIVPQTRDIFLLPGSSDQSFAKLWMNDLFRVFSGL